VWQSECVHESHQFNKRKVTNKEEEAALFKDVIENRTEAFKEGKK
jgi:hypothetical protein